MFKIFKNRKNEIGAYEVPDEQPQPVQVAVVVAQPTITAEAIQRELVSNDDAQLAEAIRLLQAPSPVSERARRLERFGFSCSEEAMAASKYDSERRAAEEKERVARQYAEQYPGLRFITTENMQAICKKYGLLLGEVRRYKGVVPDWALDRIESCGVQVSYYRISVTEKQLKLPGVITPAEPREIGIVEHGVSQMMNGGGERKFTAWTLDEKLGNELAHWPGHAQRVSRLMIAAPVSDMALWFYERVEVGSLAKPEDPIVCITVEHGYIVLCAWGEEGQDPRVFNADNN